MKNEIVYRFSNKVKLLLLSLEGTEIIGDQYKLDQIEKLYYQISKELVEVSPTIQEEYSYKTKRAYNKMLKAQKFYEDIKLINAADKEIKAVKEEYLKSQKEYENFKRIRDAIKNI